MTNDTQPNYRIAVIGSGPSGFYTAEALTKANSNIHVDLIERLPVPYGLVRAGVAPDHPKIKSVITVFERTAKKEQVRFIGNVRLGQHITIEDLKECYHAIVLCHGADADRRLGIPGEELEGSYTATSFVGWYNGHPDYRDHQFDLSGERAVIIGQGNVAIDVARILAKTPEDLAQTDIADHALEALAQKKIKEVLLVGRRGPVQAKFTTKELRELGELEKFAAWVDPEALQLDDADQQELDARINKAAPKNFEQFEGFAQIELESNDKDGVVKILFTRSPLEIKGTDGKVNSIVFGKNRLEGEPGGRKPVATGETEECSCELVFRSVGYQGTPLEGVPFDTARAVIPNQAGRVFDGDQQVDGLYVAGWIKRGPSGIIGTNKPCAVETVKSLLADLDSDTTAASRELPDAEVIIERAKANGAIPISFEDWMKIDAFEVEQGKKSAKPREKLTRIEEMLKAAGIS